MTAILSYLGLHKAEDEIFKVCRAILTWKFDDIHYFKNIWEKMFDALQGCELEK